MLKVMKPAIKDKDGNLHTASSWRHSHEDIKVDGKVPDGKKGFVLSNGDFVSRKKAAEVAYAAKQITKQVDKLHTEHLRAAAGTKEI